MFFRLHAVLRERPRNFVFRVNRETARFDPTTRPFTRTHCRELYASIYILDVYSQDPRSRHLDPKKIRESGRLSTSIKEFPSSELKDKAVVIAAGI